MKNNPNKIFTEVFIMMYEAFVRNKETKETKVIKMDYPNKKSFAADLKANGYSIKFIATEDTYDEECAKYEARLEAKRLGRAEHKKSLEKINQMAFAQVELRAFTDMLIGRYTATCTEDGYTVTTKTNVLEFDKTGKQTNAKNPRFANHIVFVG